MADNIYMLIDPDTNNPFYVGITKRGLKERLSNHFSTRNLGCYGYQNKILEIYNRRLHLPKRKRKPIIALLDECEFPESLYWEGFWIELLTTWGFELMNYNKSNKTKQGWFKTSGKVVKKMTFYKRRLERDQTIQK